MLAVSLHVGVKPYRSASVHTPGYDGLKSARQAPAGEKGEGASVQTVRLGLSATARRNTEVVRAGGSFAHLAIGGT